MRKIISTLADKEIVENKEVDSRQEGCRRSPRLTRGRRRPKGKDGDNR